jgi:hypothetical protein
MKKYLSTLLIVISFLLCNAYRPESTDSEYWTRLSHAIAMGYQVSDNIVILGDFNSDLFIANNNTLIETMMMFNLVNIIKIVFEKKSSNRSSLLIFTSKWDFVMQIISDSSPKF